jgi:hypothetical protein
MLTYDTDVDDDAVDEGSDSVDGVDSEDLADADVRRAILRARARRASTSAAPVRRPIRKRVSVSKR